MKKKIISLFIVSTLLMVMAGCQNTNIAVENYEWKMNVIQSYENYGKIIACEESEKGKLENNGEGVAVIDMIMTAKDGVLTITDITNDKKYTGKYTKKESKAESTLYSVTMNGKEWNAVLSFTKYYEGGDKATLIISNSDYSIQFFER